MLNHSHLTEWHLSVLATRPHTGGVNLRDRETRVQLCKGPCFALLENGEIWGAAGVMPMWQGVGHGWAILAVPTGTKRLRYATREVKRWLESATDWTRIQTTICAEFGQGLAWATHLLAFAPEGILRSYDEQGRDHLMLARLWPPPSPP